MRRTCLIALALAVAFAPGARAEEPLVQKVRASLDKGVGYLKNAQVNQGSGKWNWENDTLALLQEGGPSSLTMLALLTAGVPLDDPVVKRGLPFIRSLEPKHTYVVGLQTMVFAEVGATEDINRIQRNVNWLIDSAITRGGRLGQGGKLEGWGYQAGGGNAPDNSNTQYALLGLWAGRQAGAIIDKPVWQAIQDYYASTQTKPFNDGRGRPTAGWNYKGGENGKGTLTMTAAGVCGLYIAAQQLGDGQQGLDDLTGIAKNCGIYPEDDAVARGLRWLAQEFRFSNPPHTFYNVYGIERVGRLSGQRFIGEHDWYRDGCELLTGVKAESSGLAQKSAGEWRIKQALDDFPVISTSFAVLFLAKGRTPILMSKLAWDGPGERPGTGTGWNRKHNDIRHLVEYSSREIFKVPGTTRPLPLAWQIFDARQADLSTEAKFNEELSTLLQSPILYITGHEAPVLSPASKRLLKRYVDEGGFILAEACCGSPAFTEGFKRLLADKEVFGDDAVLEPLAATHPIWSVHSLIPVSLFQGDAKRQIMGLERGCKTVVVFSPQPLAGYWEEMRFTPKVGEFVGDKERGKQAYRLAGNIVAYATGFEPPKPRLDRPKILDAKDTEAKVGKRHMIELAQLKHDGGDAEPAKNALRVLAANARDKYLVDVSLNKVMVRATKPNELFRHKFLYMHGKTGFTTDEQEATNLQGHLELGGTLLADACCGSETFDKAFREMIKKVFPDKPLEVIPADDLMFGERLNGEAITKVRLRRETTQKTYEDTIPQLEGIKIEGRWAVIYSKYDIGCALEKSKSSACRGYDPDSALKLATAALLYSLKR